MSQKAQRGGPLDVQHRHTKRWHSGVNRSEYDARATEERLLKAKTQRLLLGGAILTIAAGIAFGLAKGLRQEPPKREVDNRALLVDVLQLDTLSAALTVRSQGTVLPRTQTLLGAEVGGTIVEISPKFIPGGVFRADEVLLRIDPTDYQVAVRQAEALVRQRKIEFDGAEKLRQQGYRAEAEYASAAAALASAEAELMRARRNLERTEIRLPYEGMVLSKDADLGQFVTPGTRLGITFATDYAEVRLPLTDQDLAFIDLPTATEIAATGASEGPQATLSATRMGKPANWQARIVRSEGVVDEKSRVTYAVARIDDPYRLHEPGISLPIGTFVTANIEGRTMTDVIRVPRSALRAASQLLVVDDDNRIRIRDVDVIRTDARYAYIGGGVEAGERIAISAIETPLNGMYVRTTDRPDADEEQVDQVASKDEAERDGVE
jgi:RND family efflux transporter MFP subunit